MGGPQSPTTPCGTCFLINKPKGPTKPFVAEDTSATPYESNTLPPAAEILMKPMATS